MKTYDTYFQYIDGTTKLLLTSIMHKCTVHVGINIAHCQFLNATPFQCELL